MKTLNKLARSLRAQVGDIALIHARGKTVSILSIGSDQVSCMSKVPGYPYQDLTSLDYVIFDRDTSSEDIESIYTVQAETVTHCEHLHELIEHTVNQVLIR